MSQIIVIKPFRDRRFPVEVRFQQRGEKAQEKRRSHLRQKASMCAVALISLLASCASAPLTLAPVGSGPQARLGTDRGMGDLQVYTEPEEYSEKELSYFPHTDYELFTADGKRLRRVWNHSSREDETPAVVSLPPGQYVVQAQAEFYGPVSVPVVIEPNRLTRVILQPGWNPGTNVVRSELVQMPQGYCVGWRAEIFGER